MTEDEATGHVAAWLRGRGYRIDQQRTTKQTGIDLIASGPGDRWLIEVKGGSSSRIGSPRHGKGFNSNQVIDRVMKGFFTAAELAERADRQYARIGLALPRSPTAEKYISKVRQALSKLDISVLWVEENGDVSAD